MTDGRHPELRVVDDGVVLTVHVQPGARTTGVAGRHGDALKVRVSAPPVDGRANLAVIELVADAFGVTPADVTLLAGASGRQKRLLVAGLDGARAERAVDRLLA